MPDSPPPRPDAVPTATDRMFVAISEYTRPIGEVDQPCAGHAAFLAEYYASGRILGSGRRDPAVGGGSCCARAARPKSASC